MDLTLKTKEGYFNHRVAGVIIKNNKILAQKNTKADNYYLPGGRVMFGESSEEALAREIKEELKINITDYKPIWVNECFFIENGKKYHEVGMYYLVNIDNTSFNHFEDEFETKENARVNTYDWLDIESLSNYKLYPEFIKQEVKNIGNLKLIVSHD